MAGIDAATIGRHLTPSLPLRPNKRGAHPRRSSSPSPPLSLPPLLARSTTLAEPLWLPPHVSIARPPHRLPLPGEVPSGFVTSPSPFSATAGEHQHARASSRPLSGEISPRAVPGSCCTRGAPGPHNHEPGPRPFPIQK
jgi:hypothetical protein